MNQRHFMLLALILGCVGTSSALADEVQCASDCPAGKRKVSFADGNNVNCSCVESSAMDETVEDPSPDLTAPYD